MIGEGPQERFDVGNVVDDVVAYNDVNHGDIDLAGDVGPSAQEAVARRAGVGARSPELVEHRLLLVDTIQLGGVRHERQARTTTADADIKDRPARAECSPGDAMRRRVARVGRRVDGKERWRMDPRIFGRLIQDVRRDRPCR